MQCLGYVSGVRVVVIEIAMFAIAGLRLAEEGLERIVRDL